MEFVSDWPRPAVDREVGIPHYSRPSGLVGEDSKRNSLRIKLVELTIGVMTTAILYSDEYLKHDTGHHPERRQRYLATLHGLMDDSEFWDSLVKLTPRGASDEDLARCHDPNTIELVHQACLQAELIDRVALDADTVVSEQSET